MLQSRSKLHTHEDGKRDRERDGDRCSVLVGDDILQQLQGPEGWGPNPRQPDNSKRAHFRVPAFKNTIKIQREETEKEMGAGEGKEGAKFSAVWRGGGGVRRRGGSLGWTHHENLEHTPHRHTPHHTTQHKTQKQVWPQTPVNKSDLLWGGVPFPTSIVFFDTS